MDAGNRDAVNRALLIVLGALVLVILVAPLLGGGMMGIAMISGHTTRSVVPGGNSLAGSLEVALGWLSVAAFWGALAVGLVLLARWLVSTASRSSDRSATPLEILRRRYASGEISEEEFQQMRRVLER